MPDRSIKGDWGRGDEWVKDLGTDRKAWSAMDAPKVVGPLAARCKARRRGDRIPALPSLYRGISPNERLVRAPARICTARRETAEPRPDDQA